MGLAMAHFGGLKGILSGLTKSNDHPSTRFVAFVLALEGKLLRWICFGLYPFCIYISVPFGTHM